MVPYRGQVLGIQAKVTDVYHCLLGTHPLAHLMSMEIYLPVRQGSVQVPFCAFIFYPVSTPSNTAHDFT